MIACVYSGGRLATGRRLATCPTIFLVVLAATGSVSFGQTPAPSAVFTQYCVTCHNSRLKTAGLVLDPGELTHVSSNAEVWEKVVRKLRTNAMPPAGMPRPDQATYDSVATYLETELDPRRCRESESRQAAFAASPEPHRI